MDKSRRKDSDHRQRRTSPLFAAAGLATALLCAACGSSGATSANTATTTATPATTAPTSTAPRSGTRAATIRAASGCLVTHGVPIERVAAAFGRAPTSAAVPTVDNQTLQAAGTACQATLNSTAAGVVQQLDTCMASHGVVTANTGSPLADIILLDPASTAVQSAVSACVTAGQARK
jgi:hypothetical protein